MSAEPIDPAVPPKLVTWAYRLWLTSAGLLALVGLVTIILGGTASAFVFGIFFIAVAAGVVFLARRAYPGDPRWRSSIGMLTLVLTAMSLFGSLLFGPVLALILISSIVGMAGSMAAYRPSSEPWFAQK
jgi:hypothetical protein